MGYFVFTNCIKCVKLIYKIKKLGGYHEIFEAGM